MPFDPANPYSSINTETGLLEDIDELRDVARRLVLFIKVIANMGLLDFAFSKPALFDIAASIAMMESMTVETTQANFQRTLGLIMGASPTYVEEVIRKNNLSEEYPPMHPKATPVDVSQVKLDPNDPSVQDSKLLQNLVEYLGEVQGGTPVQPLSESSDSSSPRPTNEEVGDVEPVELPEGMENFLRDVLGTVEGENDDPDGDGNRGSEAS